MEFLAAWPDAFGCQYKPQVGHFGVAEETFDQIDFELVLFELGENLVENLQMVLVGGGMDDDVIDVDNDVLNAIEDFFHKSLKRGWTA